MNTRSKIFLFSSLILLIVFFTGLGVYFDQLKLLQQHQSKLKLQMAQNQKSVDEQKNYQKKDNRILITDNNKYDYFPCGTQKDFEFNTQDPVDVAYFQGLGVSVAIPFNPNWGTEEYKVKPYDYLTQDKVLLFGPLVAVPPCSVDRHYQLRFSLTKNIDQIYQEKKQTAFPDNVKKIKLKNGLNAVWAYENPMCNLPTLIIEGKNYTYTISLRCRDVSYLEADFNFLKSIAESMVINDSVKTDFLLGEWFTPHAAARRLDFSKGNQVEFSEWEDEKSLGEFVFDGHKLRIIFNDPTKEPLDLEYEKDISASYLKNEALGEYFVKVVN